VFVLLFHAKGLLFRQNALNGYPTWCHSLNRHTAQNETKQVSLESQEHYLYLRVTKELIGNNADMPETGEVRQLFMGMTLCIAIFSPPNKSTPTHSNARPHIDRCYTTKANQPAH
jgi:hypothetical protein